MGMKRKTNGQMAVKSGSKPVMETFVASTGATGLILYNASGTACYVTPNAGGTALAVSTTKP